MFQAFLSTIIWKDHKGQIMVRIIGIRNMVFHIWYIPVYIHICDRKINHIPTLHKITQAHVKA